MNAAADFALKTLRLLPRAAFVALLLGAPMLAVSSLEAGQQTTIEAPTPKKMGAGLVLLVSLQRA